MKTLLNIGIGVVLSIGFYACCKGGAGGDATITAYPYHHAKPIPGAIVYVKYDATEPPGIDPSQYDAKFVAGPTDLSIKCTGLHCGNYFLYSVGYDSAISQTVTGGIAVKIKYSDRKTNTNTDVPITE